MLEGGGDKQNRTASGLSPGKSDIFLFVSRLSCFFLKGKSDISESGSQ